MVLLPVPCPAGEENTISVSFIDNYNIINTSLGLVG